MLHLHLGDHTGLHLRALAAHALEWDHLVFAGMAVLFALWAYRQGRRVEARVRIEKDKRG